MEEPKYAKGQKVEIIPVETPHGQSKYPELEEHVGKCGVVVSSHPEQFEIHGSPVDIWGYIIRLEKDDSQIMLLEDALELQD